MSRIPPVLGTVMALSLAGCPAEKGRCANRCFAGDGGETGEGSGGSVTPTAECTTDTEPQLVRGPLSRRGALPGECRVDALTGTYAGEIAPFDSVDNSPGRNQGLGNPSRVRPGCRRAPARLAGVAPGTAARPCR
jgi:hypothetical protein